MQEAYALLCEIAEAVPEEDEPPVCPVCRAGYGCPLGSLGRLEWFRCRACGIDFNASGAQRVAS